MPKVCCAIDRDGRCDKAARCRLSGEIGGLAELATFTQKRGRFPRELSFDFNGEFAGGLCSGHSLDVFQQVFHHGLGEERPKTESFLVDLSAYLIANEINLTLEEVRAPANARAQIVEVASKKRSFTKAALDQARELYFENRERESKTCSGRRDAVKSLTSEASTQTDDEQAPPWFKHELSVLLCRVLEHGPSLGSYLRNDTYTYCLIHTALRHILIAAHDGIGLGKLYSTDQSQVILILIEANPGVFTRSVMDTLAGVGQKGLGVLAVNLAYNAADRHTFCGFPSWSALQKMRPRSNGVLLEPNAEVADIFARLVKKTRPPGAPERVLAALSMDCTKGNGSDSSFSYVIHVVDGVSTGRIIGAAAKADGSACMITAADVQGLLFDAATVEASTGVESCMLHTLDTSLPGGFLAGFVPISKETSELLQNLFRKWRALLIPHGIELVVLCTDFGGPNRNAFSQLAIGAPSFCQIFQFGSWRHLFHSMKCYLKHSH